MKCCGQNPEEKQHPRDTRAHGSKNAGAAQAAKEKAEKKASVDVAAKEKDIKNSKSKATAVITRAVMASDHGEN